MKYLKLFLFLGMISIACLTNNVLAQSDSFHEGEAVTNAYLKKFKPGESTGKYEQMKIFRRDSDNQAAYCIELWTDLIPNKKIDGYVTKYAERAAITEEQWKRIQLIGYYGYEYENHTTDNWYAASQFLIWKTLEPNSTIYFTDTLNGNRVSKFESEISEIESLIAQHEVLPSFANTIHTVNMGKYTTIEDTNHVIKNYEISTKDDIFYEKHNDSRIRVMMNRIGSAEIELTKEDTTRKTLLYVSPSSQNLMVRGNYPKITTSFKIKVESGKIILKKVDQETGNQKPQGDASFEGTTYELYDENHKVIKTIQITGNQSVTIDSLAYGTYYIKEVKSGKGYRIDPMEYNINLNVPVITFTSRDIVYKGKVKIQKYSEEGTTLKEEENAEFEVYNSQDKLIDKIKTNLSGQVEITLPYGTYRFHQSKGKKEHQFVDDFFVTIEEKMNQEYQFIFKNEPIKRYLKVVKKDAKTKKEIIIGNASFRIKNLDTGEYIKQRLSYPNGEMIEVFTTNEQGFFITAEPLAAGNYQLEEINPPYGYYPLNQPFTFRISEEIETINDPNYGKIISLEIYNEPKIGTLIIQKQGEIVEIQKGFHYSYIGLENIYFSVYAEEDILSGDGTKLYSKGNLVIQKETNSDGNIQISLPIGKYSVIEATFLDSYIKNEKKYFVEITPDNLETKLKVYNYLKKGNLTILKKDSITGNPIADTYFSIYTKDGKFITTMITDQNGIAVLEKIPLGEYYLEESKSNRDYILDSSKVEFKITELEKEITIDLQNEPIMPPKTAVDKKQVKVFLIAECLFEFLIGFIIICRISKFKKKS